MLRKKRTPCALEYGPTATITAKVLTHIHRQAQLRPQSAVTHSITITLCARCSYVAGGIDDSFCILSKKQECH